VTERRATLPPELLEELEAAGASPSNPPTAENWQALLGRLGGMLRARSFGRQVGALGHELRTPMTVVIGGTELLLETELDAQQRAALQGVHRSGQQLLSVLNEILDDPRESGAPPETERLPENGTLQARILVVEDNEFNRALIGRALAVTGASVETVSSGIDAVAKYATANYDVILMDCHMPQLDGFETTREIRRLERTREHIPIIGVTAGTAVGMRRACLAAGMDDYIAKPFSLLTLRQRVAYWLARGSSSHHAQPPPVTIPIPNNDSEIRLDPSRLDELARDAGPAIALELSEIFMHDMARRLAQLGEAIERADLPAELALAHAVKGACGNFGASRMALLAQDVEHCLKTGAVSMLPKLHEELESELVMVRALLEARGLIQPPHSVPSAAPASTGLPG
jgi:CheY-like chemotaxis protein/HPt (histidine-containing phosphotransfer) domain-containing protein